MVAERRALWADIAAKAAFTEPPPESRRQVREMLGDDVDAPAASAARALAEMDVEVG